MARVEVGLFGESCVEGTCARSDLLFALPEDQREPAGAAPLAQPIATTAEPVEGRAVTKATAMDPSASPPIAVAIIGAGVLLLVVVATALIRGLGRQPRRAAADETGPAGSRPRPEPVSRSCTILDLPLDGDIVGAPVGTVGSRLHYATGKLRSALKADALPTTQEVAQ